MDAIGYIRTLLGFLQPFLPPYIGQILQLIDIGLPVLAAVKKAFPAAVPIIKEIAAHAFPETTSDPVAWAQAKELTATAIFAPDKMTEEMKGRWLGGLDGGIG